MFIAGAALATLAKPFAAPAQSANRLPRIGMLSFGTAPAGSDPDPAIGFSQGLSEHGYVESRNFLVERRYAGGRPERLDALAAELVRLKVELILAGGPAPREAARKATRTIPIVTVFGSDPVSEGWAESLAHPGGNVTGMTVTFPELGAKSLEVLNQAVPEIVRFGVLFTPAEAVYDGQFKRELELGAGRLGPQLQSLPIRGPEDFDAAFALAQRSRVQAVVAIATNTVVAHRSRLAALATRAGLPSITEFPLLVQAGFLMSYGADLDDLGRRSITLVDKILKGSRAGDLPIERPTKFQLTVNLGTAKALGITIPQALLLRADEVIQ
jgi:putative ABC transport system substrate-binding protein